MSLTELARDLAMSPSAVSYAVERGEVIALDNNYQLVDY
jgi:DNA-binding transcriptional LysR family regulator